MGSFATHAEPLAKPGDMLLRHDIKLLVDEGVISVPASSWPIPWGDIHDQLSRPQNVAGSEAVNAAMQRLQERARWELDSGGFTLTGWASVAAEPRVIRAFEDTPREEAEAGLAFSWTGTWATVNLSGAYVNDPLDGDEFRPDDTYVGAVVGNWMVTAGWQQRWWGPGNDGSLILTGNARPRPGVSLQRNLSTPFKTKWLSWLGPWSMTTFMEQLDDERVVNDALLWGFRFSFRPLQSLEIGLSRTAQWCGDDRPCDFGTFVDLLLGNDNGGINVDPEDEPGNQLGGIDMRWTLPKAIPLALYIQWIGEDACTGSCSGRFVTSFSRQLGIEHRGTIGGLSHRTHLEWSEVTCAKGGVGGSERNPNCAYEHHIYQTGYRYKGRPIGHGTDGDGRSYSFGSTLVQSAGHTWNVILRYMEINREGPPSSRHTLSPTPQDRIDIQVSHDRTTRYGRFYVGIGYNFLDDKASGTDSSDVTGFIRWSTR
jgi:hypothetical protein